MSGWIHPARRADEDRHRLIDVPLGAVELGVMLEMVCRYGRDLDGPPTVMPSGWAAVLYLYDLR